MNEKEKVYCKECKYCGDIVYNKNPDFMSHMPLDSIKIFYMHGVEIEERYCKNPDISHIEEYDTFYTHIKNHFTPICHEINKNNDCKYFNRKGKK